MPGTDLTLTSSEEVRLIYDHEGRAAEDEDKRVSTTPRPPRTRGSLSRSQASPSWPGHQAQTRTKRLQGRR